MKGGSKGRKKGREEGRKEAKKEGRKSKPPAASILLTFSPLITVSGKNLLRVRKETQWEQRMSSCHDEELDMEWLQAHDGQKLFVK